MISPDTVRLKEMFMKDIFLRILKNTEKYGSGKVKIKLTDVFELTDLEAQNVIEQTC